MAEHSPRRLHAQGAHSTAGQNRPWPGRGERGLAHLKRIAPQVVAVQLDQIEGVQEDAGVVPPIADASKLGLPSSSQPPYRR
jgi:hypothetical protein